MADKASEKDGIQALKVYKKYDMSLKDFKARAAEVGVTVKGAVSRLSQDQVDMILAHLGIEAEPEKKAEEAPEEAPKKAEASANAPKAEAKPKAKSKAKAEPKETEEERKAKAEAAKKAAAEALEIDARFLGSVNSILGEKLKSADDVTDEVKKRAKPLKVVWSLATEFDVSGEDVARNARKLGIEVGRKGFKGFSTNEEFMLKAFLKQELNTKEERLKEVAASEEEYTPAAPTGNKAVEPRREERRKTERRGRGHTGGPQGGGFPPMPPSQTRDGGRRRRRFEGNQIQTDRRRPGGNRRKGRRRRDEQTEQIEQKPIELPTGPVTVEMPLNMRQLSEAMGVKANEIMARMLQEGLPLVRINDTLSKDIIEQIGIIFDRDITVEEPKAAEDLIQEQLETFDEGASEELPRAPIVTVMGHVDHGKTSLLDAIAKLDRVADESGGITQHIGAFRLDLTEKDGKFTPVRKDESADAKRLRVTFIDTPGHEAFTAMRARGANVTDIAVIVVAADDGVMPQTAEAIAHARDAEVEIVVAITKIDKPEANIAKVRQELATHELMSPDWGGTTEIIELSSITGENVDKLVQLLSDMAEILELEAIVDKPAVGTVLEANRDVGRGIVATMLIREGTLRQGDVIVAGHGYGRVRSMQESRGDGLHTIDIAGPSVAVEVAGLDEMPEAGSLFHGMKNIKKAAEIASMVRQQERELERSKGFSLEEWSRAREGQSIRELVIVLKCDVQGSVETIKAELEKLQNDEVRVKVIHSAVGGITTTDVHLAEAADGIVVGFHVGVDAKARELADNHHIDIRTYEVIYKLIEEIHDALSGLLAPDLIESYLGTAEVRRVFKISRVGTIAGCMVTKGTIKRGARVRLQRDGSNIFETDVQTLKREKDDASEVREGFECGIQLKNFNDIKEGDIIEAFEVAEKKRTLEIGQAES